MLVRAFWLSCSLLGSSIPESYQLPVSPSPQYPTAMAHIGHILASRNLSYGGPVVALAGLANQQSIEHEVSVFYEFPSDGKPSPLDSFNPVQLPSRSLMNRFGIGDSREAHMLTCEQFRHVDILHLHGIWEDIQCQGARYARSNKVPYVIRTCGMLDPWSLTNRSRFKKKLYLKIQLQKMLENASAIHFTTQREAELAAPFARDEQVIIEPNGIDLSTYDELPKPGSLREKLGVGERPLVLFLGRIAPKKGLDILLPAFAKMNNQEAVLAVAGPDEGGHVQQVKEIIKRLGIADRVFFTGSLHNQEKLQALVDADLFALTSYQENFGNAVLEAMACETPVLISNQVNLCDDVTRSESGLVVPLDRKATTKALNQLVEDPQKAKEMGRNGRMLAQNHFAWPMIASRWDKHYESFINLNN